MAAEKDIFRALRKLSPVIVFRADASVSLGGGHVMRCLALADELSKQGAVCYFACTAQSYETVASLSDSRHGRIELEVPDAEALVRSAEEAGIRGCEWLVVDHYGWKQDDERKCRPWASRILVIDDLADRKHDCDLLVLPSLGGSEREYVDLVPPSCEILVGPSYAPLRPGFAKARAGTLAHRTSGKLDRILVSMGLTDPTDAASVVVKGVLASGIPAAIDIISGAKALNADALRRLAIEHPQQITLHFDISYVPRLIEDADLAIGAAGSSAWERCVLGLPSLMTVVAENQNEICAMLHERGAAVSLGPRATLTPHRVAKAVTDLHRSPDQLILMAQRAAIICDGRGARRLAMRMLPEFDRNNRPVWLRPASSSDVDLIYKWQLEPATRRFARNPETPTRREHESWLLSKLADPACLFGIIVLDGQPAGVLRLSMVDTHEAEISINIGEDFIKRSVGLAALKLARRLMPDADLLAEVLPGNVASEKLFTRLGFLPVGYGKRWLKASEVNA